MLFSMARVRHSPSARQGGWEGRIWMRKALVRATEALGTIEPSGPIERALARLPLPAYKRQLRTIVEAAPSWVTEELLSAGEHIGDQRAEPILPMPPSTCWPFLVERGIQPRLGPGTIEEAEEEVRTLRDYFER